VKNRMRVIRSSGSVRGGAGDIPAYSAQGVFADADWRHDLAHVDAVLQHGVTDGHVLQRDFVADRNVLLGLDIDRLVRIHDPAGHVGAGLHAFDHHDSHGVARVVQYEVNHRFVSW